MEEDIGFIIAGEVSDASGEKIGVGRGDDADVYFRDHTVHLHDLYSPCTVLMPEEVIVAVDGEVSLSSREFCKENIIMLREEKSMQSVITSKFQTTIPKKVRESLKLTINDTLEWKIERGKTVVIPVQKRFLNYKNAIKTGAGKIEEDIILSRNRRIEKYL